MGLLPGPSSAKRDDNTINKAHFIRDSDPRFLLMLTVKCQANLFTTITTSVASSPSKSHNIPVRACVSHFPSLSRTNPPCPLRAAQSPGRRRRAAITLHGIINLMGWSSTYHRNIEDLERLRLDGAKQTVE